MKPRRLGNGEPSIYFDGEFERIRRTEIEPYRRNIFISSSVLFSRSGRWTLSYSVAMQRTEPTLGPELQIYANWQLINIVGANWSQLHGRCCAIFSGSKIDVQECRFN